MKLIHDIIGFSKLNKPLEGHGHRFLKQTHKCVSLLLGSAALAYAANATGGYVVPPCVGTHVANSVELLIAVGGFYGPNPSTGMVTMPGDTICLDAGTYVTDTNYRLPWASFNFPFFVAVDNLTLQGAGMDETILSGDLLGDDLPLDPDNPNANRNILDNSIQVILVNTGQLPGFPPGFPGTVVKKLTIKDLSIKGGNASIFGNGLYNKGAAITMRNVLPGSRLALERVGVHDNTVSQFGAVTASCFTCNGVNTAELDIKDSRFTNNLGGQNGGAIATDNMLVKVHGSVFDNNHVAVLTQTGSSQYAGGAIDARFTAPVDIQNNLFINNSAAYGGAVRVSTNPNVPAIPFVGPSTVSNNVFVSNRLFPGMGMNGIQTFAQVGGALLVESYTNIASTTSARLDTAFVTVDGNVFLDNTAVGSGGGLGVLNANLNLGGNLFAGNEAGLSGGGAQLGQIPGLVGGEFFAYKMMIEDNAFFYNEATDAGALNVYEGIPGGAEFELTQNAYLFNKASGDVGALAVLSDDVISDREVFIGNTAGGNGGAIGLSSAVRNAGEFQLEGFPGLNLTDLISALVIKNGTFLFNYAGNAGGAISDTPLNQAVMFVDGPYGYGEQVTYTGPGLGVITVENSTLSYNRANGNGGAIALTGQGQRKDYILEPFTEFPWLPDDGSDLLYSTLNLTNSTVKFNNATSGKDVFFQGGMDYNVTITNSKIGKCVGAQCP